MSDHHSDAYGGWSGLLTVLTWLFNGAAIVTKEDAAFAMGMLVGLMAVINHYLGIRKNLKK